MPSEMVFQQPARGSGSVDLSGTPVWPNGVTVAAEAAFMVAAVAAATVVVKNVRLFIVTSQEVLRNLVNADQDSELPRQLVFKLGDCRSDLGNRSTNRTRLRAPRPLTPLPTIP